MIRNNLVIFLFFDIFLIFCLITACTQTNVKKNEAKNEGISEISAGSNAQSSNQATTALVSNPQENSTAVSINQTNEAHVLEFTGKVEITIKGDVSVVNNPESRSRISYIVYKKEQSEQLRGLNGRKIQVSGTVIMQTPWLGKIDIKKWNPAD